MRIQSMSEFWPYYLSEHNHPGSRALHFVGTTAFFASVIASLVNNPTWMVPALAIATLGGALGALVVEPKRAAFLPMLLVVVPLAIAGPGVLGGVLVAYGCAWVGHFRLEHNRPATFSYPVWSFLCDFRMWSHMVRGRLWSGAAHVPGNAPVV